MLTESLKAVEATWSCAEDEWATASKALKFCGVEVTMDANGNEIHLAQSSYEKELLDRWGTNTGSDFSMFNFCESDFEGVEDIDAGILKEAQALAGGLLWLSTKTRPDLAYGMATMSRLMTKNPEKPVEVGHALLRHIKTNPRYLHYFREMPNDGWGEEKPTENAEKQQHRNYL